MNFEEKAVDRIKKLEREVERLRVKESPGAWQNWTPTLNTGDADLSGYSLARYCQVGKLVFITFDAGNESVSGSPGLIYIGLPVAAKYSSRDLSAVVYPIGGTYAKVQCQTMTTPQTMFLAKGMFANLWSATETGVYIRINGFYEAA